MQRLTKPKNDHVISSRDEDFEYISWPSTRRNAIDTPPVSSSNKKAARRHAIDTPPGSSVLTSNKKEDRQTQTRGIKSTNINPNAIDVIYVDDEDEDDEDKATIPITTATPILQASNQAASIQTTNPDVVYIDDDLVENQPTSPSGPKDHPHEQYDPERINEHEIIVINDEDDRVRPAEQWPTGVTLLTTYLNPNGIHFPYDKTFGECGCTIPCTQRTCMNASLGIFCTPQCCTFNGRCGNSLQLSASLRLMVDTSTNSYSIQATDFIQEGVIIGEYFGSLTLENIHMPRPQNKGYRLEMVHASKHPGRERVMIDATQSGSLMRFLNHSCDPLTRFYEKSNGHQHTIAVVTIRDIFESQEVTVDYGPALWFVCRCGTSTCRHKNIQINT